MSKPAAKPKGKGKEEEAPPAPVISQGKFYFKDGGATYEGEHMVLSSSAAPEPAKAGDASAAPAEEQRVRHGKGTYVEGGYKYEGEWQNDKMHGSGAFTYASGACYTGQWQAGEYQGQGKYSWPDGRCYEGEWQHNRMHGQGVYQDAHGHRWTGQFFNGSGPGLTCMQ